MNFDKGISSESPKIESFLDFSSEGSGRDKIKYSQVTEILQMAEKRFLAGGC